MLAPHSPLLTLDGAGTPNPAGRGRSHGGGDYGAAVAVSAGLADLALGVDELGTARVPAACCGAYALRTTAGLLPLEHASAASHSLAAPALLAADPAVLLRAGAALRLPGGALPVAPAWPPLQLNAVDRWQGTARTRGLAAPCPLPPRRSALLCTHAGGAATEVPQYLVAEDLFAACGEEARAMVPAVVAAVKVRACAAAAGVQPRASSGWACCGVRCQLGAAAAATAAAAAAAAAADAFRRF